MVWLLRVRHLFDITNTLLGAIFSCEWNGGRGMRHIFDISNTVLCEKIKCEWIAEGR